MVKMWVNAETADIVVANLSNMRRKAKRDASNRNMLIGGTVCVIGIGITAVTYAAAMGRGTYIVAWGAIVFGAIQFFMGLAQRSG